MVKEHLCYYLRPNILDTRKSNPMIMATTMKIPKPIPALKIPPITSQLEKVNKIVDNTAILKDIFCMIIMF